MTRRTTSGSVAFRELTPDDWPLVRQLFGSRGACGGCWCMHWRREKGGQAWEKVKGEPNRRAFKKLVESGRANGILALDREKPIGWCSFGPRVDFPRLERTKAYRYPEGSRLADQHPNVWSINCFYLHRDYRRQGLITPMIQATIEAIRKRRGRLVEAYPVTLTGDGNKLPAAFSYTGPEIVFQRLGFKEVQRLAPSRPLYQLELT
jgi:GNAT superfamily N-acetyltransferase